MNENISGRMDGEVDASELDAVCAERNGWYARKSGTW